MAVRRKKDSESAIVIRLLKEAMSPKIRIGASER
jgi:hypothetical protein